MANLFAVPNYVKASSPLGLRRQMYSVQIKDSMQYKFFDISFSDGSWYAWYFYEPKSEPDKLNQAKQLLSNQGS